MIDITEVPCPSKHDAVDIWSHEFNTIKSSLIICDIDILERINKGMAFFPLSFRVL